MSSLKKVINLHQPNSTSSLIKSLKKRIEHLESQSNFDPMEAFLIVPSEDGSIFLNQKDIIHCTAAGSSCVIQTKDQRFCISRTLKWVADRLFDRQFIRVHSSHLINASNIVKYRKSANTVIELKSGTIVPVSRSRREQVEQFFNL